MWRNKPISLRQLCREINLYLLRQLCEEINQTSMVYNFFEHDEFLIKFVCTRNT